MNKGLKRFLIGLFVACIVTLTLCAVYYIYHPEEAERGIVTTMDSIDDA